jgi:hypothetical protein
VELYRGLGPLLGAALGVIWLLLLQLTVPIACWGFAKTAPEDPKAKRRLAAATTVGIALGIAVAFALGPSANRIITLHGEPGAIEPVLRRAARIEGPARSARGNHPVEPAAVVIQPAHCPSEMDVLRFTLLLTFFDRERRAVSRCVQAPDLTRLETQLRELIEQNAAPDSSIKLDLVSALQHVEPRDPLFDALAIRPGLDGVCIERRCLAPWQLVALDAFTRYRPIPAVKDASFGVSTLWLSDALGERTLPPRFVRLETYSYVSDERGFQPLPRALQNRRPVSQRALGQAVRSAEEYIRRSQLEDGRFRYLVDPFGRTSDSGSFNLPRQAGTTLALCELGHAVDLRSSVERSLELLASAERRLGSRSALSIDDRIARLGHSALPLAAFLTCRGSIGATHDPLIARLGEFLLGLQRDNGSFFPELDLTRGAAQGSHEALYSAGQAVLALVLLEQLQADLHAAPKPARARVSAAIDRAMAYYAGPYWDGPLSDFFFLEENWHCLAARAALSSHRNDAYERFCLDYVAFKRRFIMRSGETAEQLVGGFTVSNLFPPYNTPTAGFGEALAAALAVKRVRGLPRAADEALLKEVLGFLLTAQRSSATCFGCTDEAAVHGGFSEHFASPIIRIDYVQHAMAALGHGARVLYEN